MTARFPRPEVLSRLSLSGHGVIEASAGTGKTYTIEHLVVDILLGTETTIDRILVLTFTEKATAELKRRVRAKLKQILSESADGPPSADQWVIDGEARRRLEAALFSFDTASIHTIHGFFQRVMTSSAFPIGRPLVQELVDGRTAFARAFRSTLRGRAGQDPGLLVHLEAWLKPRERTLATLEDLSYKCLPFHRRQTRFWPAYDANGLETLLTGVELPPCPTADELCLDTPGLNKNSARAMASRMEYLHQRIRTFRSDRDVLAFLSAMSDKKPKEYRLERIYEYLSEHAGESAITGSWLALIEQLVDRCVTIESAAVQTILPAVVAELDSFRSARGQFDFDDMVRLVWEALDGPGGESLVQGLRERYAFGLIDEFQDTDELQWQIFQRIFFRPGGRHVCYLVGDPKQAIYGFRGADVHAYLAATRMVRGEANGAAVRLDRSFRSTGPLLSALNHIFDQNAGAPFFTDPRISYAAPVTPGRPALQLRRAGDAIDAVPPVLFLRVTSERPKIPVESVRRRLAAAIAADIRSNLQEGRGMLLGEPGKEELLRARDVFVLTRTTSEGLQVGRALRDAGVPHSFYKQDGLFQTPEAQDVRDILMAVDDPGFRSRRFKAWLTPFFDVPLSSLHQLVDIPHSDPLVQQLEHWHELAARREHERLFSELIDGSGLVRRLLARGDGERELTNYAHLFEILLGQAQRGARVADLVADLTAYIDGEKSPPGEDANVQRLESDRDAVQIMTMHKSKGLEAGVVYLFGAFSGSAARKSEAVLFHDGSGCRLMHLGSAARAIQARDRERRHEDQRLLYVAMTRARGRLVLPILPEHGIRDFEKSAYWIVNQRIGAVLPAADPRLFEVRDVDVDAPLPRRGGGALATVQPVRWPEEPDDRREVEEMQRLASRHAPVQITSYSRMKRAHGGYVSPLDIDLVSDSEVETPEREKDPIPGGIHMGIFLHAVIEELDLTTLSGGPDLASWAADERVKNGLDDLFARFGVPVGVRPAVEALVHRCLLAPVRAGEIRVPGLATVPALSRELEFLFPYPEAAHPLLSAAPAGPFTIERGYVKGVIDLVFELGGRFYFADWKTDILPSYSAGVLTRHVENNYRLQAKLYSLAMVKMLNIGTREDYDRLFGGLLYCFLRGMGTGEPESFTGLYFERPDWGTIAGFEARMRTAEELE